MCDYCGCRGVPAIADLMAEHAALVDQAGLLRETLRSRDFASAMSGLTELVARLTGHVRREEDGIFTALRSTGEYVDEVNALEDEHRDLEATIAELDIGSPDFAAQGHAAARRPGRPCPTRGAGNLPGLGRHPRGRWLEHRRRGPHQDTQLPAPQLNTETEEDDEHAERVLDRTGQAPPGDSLDGAERPQRPHHLRRPRTRPTADPDRVAGGHEPRTSTRTPARPRSRSSTVGSPSWPGRTAGTGRRATSMFVPDSRHALEAVEDSVVLLTVAKRP